MEADSEYFARRAREEREAAKAASGIEARTSHLELAARYTDIAKALEKQSSYIARVRETLTERRPLTLDLASRHPRIVDSTRH